MAEFTQGNYLTRKAGADLSAAANQYKIAKTDSSGNAVLAAAATDKFIGVLDHLGTTNDNVTIQLRNSNGTMKVRCGGTISKDAYVTSDSAGLGVATTTAADQILGQALEAGVVNQVIQIIPMFRVHP